MDFRIEQNDVTQFVIDKFLDLSPDSVSPFWISDWLECMLRTTALNNSPPTTCTRWCLIFSTIVYNAYAYVASRPPLDYSNPSGHNYWPSNTTGASTVPFQVWMEHVCQWMMPILLTQWMPYSISPYVSPNPAYLQLDPADASSYQRLVAAHAPLQPLDAFTLEQFYKFQALVTQYFSARQQDGWLTTFTFNQSYNNNANLSSFIDGTNQTQQNLNALLPNPEKWTPVKIPTPSGGTVVKGYVTPEWGTSNTGILSNADRAAIQANAQQLFPDPVTKSAQWRKEIQDVLDAQSNLTDEEKLISEYWLQCPGATVNSTGAPLYGTPSPSGVWLILADVWLRSNGKTILDEIRYYAVLSYGIFEASMNAWKLKRTNLQARPIQKIRQLLYDPTRGIDAPIHQDWNPLTPTVGNIPLTSSGSYWLPFQTLDTVTPPFPDFVSGHSTFGAAAARLMAYLTGTDTVVLQNPVITLSAFRYTSQLYYNNDAWRNVAITDLFFYPGCSAVQPADPTSPSGGFNGSLQVPLSGLRLRFPTWSDMAQSNGNSRIYGGVHWESSNQGGLLAGKQVADMLWSFMKTI